MKYCAWCRKEIEENALTASTHGLCGECFQKFRANPRKSRLLAGAIIHYRANQYVAKLLDEEVAPAGF